MPPPLRRREHPYQANSLADIPAGLRDLVVQALRPDEPAATLFVIPEQMLSKNWNGIGGMHRVPEQVLIFTARGVIHAKVGKSANEKGQVSYIRGEDVLYAQMNLVLLYGRLEIFSSGSESHPHIVVEYNAIIHEMLLPPLQDFLRLAWEPSPIITSDILHSADLLVELENHSYKFKSGLELYSLRPGEYLLGLIYQPAILKHYLRVIHRPVAPTSVIALTDTELKIITEGLSGANLYGYFLTYCPRQNLAGIEIIERGNLYQVCIRLSKGDETAFLLVTMEKENALACQELYLQTRMSDPALSAPDRQFIA